MRKSLLALFAITSALTACVAPTEEPTEELSSTEADLTANQRVSRYTKMRDAARAHGIPSNAYMLAGIAFAETGVAMCWSEATWACKGPSSPDCGGGPVIAGSADGPCRIEQGGLGIFQFDAGTFDQTIAKYGRSVLTIDGQMKAAIAYVTDMVRRSDYTTNAETPAKALAWINRFDPANPTLRDQWIKTVIRYYNGCYPGTSCWNARYRTYNQGLDIALSDTGGRAFWSSNAAGNRPPSPDCNVRNAILHCGNKANADMYATTDLDSKEVNTLVTKDSFFECWTKGETHLTNDTWYRTVGDENPSRGYVPASSLYTTSEFDRNPGEFGLPRCK